MMGPRESRDTSPRAKSGRPLIAGTTVHATRLAASAPKTRPVSSEGQPVARRSSASAMPHSPPQKAELSTAGTPKGGMGRSE